MLLVLLRRLIRRRVFLIGGGGGQSVVGVELSAVRVEAADFGEGAGAERAVELLAVGGGLGVDPSDVSPQVACKGKERKEAE